MFHGDVSQVIAYGDQSLSTPGFKACILLIPVGGAGGYPQLWMPILWGGAGVHVPAWDIASLSWRVTISLDIDKDIIIPLVIVSGNI